MMNFNRGLQKNVKHGKIFDRMPYITAITIDPFRVVSSLSKCSSIEKSITSFLNMMGPIQFSLFLIYGMFFLSTHNASFTLK